MRFSKREMYAFSALYLLNQRAKAAPVSCKEIAAAGEMPQRFLLHILGKLTQAGLLTSTRGVEGGYQLAQPIENITVLDVLNAVDDSKVAADKGEQAKERVDSSHGKLPAPLGNLHSRLHTMLQQLKLDQFFAPAPSEGDVDIKSDAL